jgi:uncharacterized protein YciI
MRSLALTLAFFGGGALAGPPLFTLVSDALDADAPAATLPAGPVELALTGLAREQPQAAVLEPLRTGERNGQRYALAAWRSAPAAKEWDALLVVATAQGARALEISSTHKDRAAALEALIAYGTSGSAPAAAARPAAAAASAAPLPLPAAWDPRFVVFLSRNPAYRPGDAAAEKALTDAHIQYTLRLQAEGKALAAGPFAAPAAEVAGSVPIGMTLLRVRDLAAAEGIATADPAVVAGRLLATVREWNVPAGRLQ